jgi:hypothetical protein
MVAYSFQPRFVAPILAGTKRQTIRRPRRRHAREGEEMQLYTGMRTRHCRLICRRTCIGASPITLVFDDNDPDEGEGVIAPGFGIGEWGYASLDQFAIGDGFANWAELRAFWREHHADKLDERGMWDGHIIFWGA